jgi:hypothetical protein
MKLAVWSRSTIARLYRRRGGAEEEDQQLLVQFKIFVRLTATTMAGLAASLAGTEINIWMFDGLLPKPVTCWRAPKAELAEANKANAVVKAFMLMLYRVYL